MDNPANAVKHAQAAAELQDHVLTRQAARDANKDYATPGQEFWPPILTFLMCTSTRYSALMSHTENTTPNYQSSLIRPIKNDICL